MNKYTVTIDGRPWVRITKAEARNRWDAKQRLYIAPCNLHPGGPWGIGLEISSDNGYSNAFDDVVNSFEFYNCLNSETGKYASFYKPCGE